jgi:hypothetical protein
MSDPVNDVFLESAKDRFEEGDEQEKLNVIAQLREEGFDEQAAVLERSMHQEGDPDVE